MRTSGCCVSAFHAPASTSRRAASSSTSILPSSSSKHEPARSWSSLARSDPPGECSVRLFLSPASRGASGRNSRLHRGNRGTSGWQSPQRAQRHYWRRHDLGSVAAISALSSGSAIGKRISRPVMAFGRTTASSNPWHLAAAGGTDRVGEHVRGTRRGGRLREHDERTEAV
jgi:hypothetical protein